MQSVSQNKTALRIDDIGASSKFFERYSKKRLCNVGVLRHRKLFGAWGPYREMSGHEWDEVLEVLQRHGAKLTVGVTAAWVERDGRLIPFPEKFPVEAKALKEGLKVGLIEIANHGLTHCVLENDKFRPRLLGNNRKSHREFWDWLPDETHFEHLERSQKILQDFFEEDVVTLIPPGNVYSGITLKAAQKTGLKIVNCQNPKIFPENAPLKVIGNQSVIAFHDRELVLYGIAWLEKVLQENKGKEFCFVKEL